MKPEDFKYVVKNNICLFQIGPLSQWWGGFKNQDGGFKDVVSDVFPVMSKELYEYLYAQNSSFVKFNCCEQFMMAAKAAIFNDLDTLKEIMNTPYPKDQKELGRSVKNFNPEVWDEYKFSVVYRANILKFSQNEESRKFLESFNPHIIFAEASHWDKIWGIGMDATDERALDVTTWDGQNLLGKAITMVRDQLLY